MQVGLLTTEQKNSLIGQQYAPDCYFNPIQDINNDWVISTQEIEDCAYEEFFWVKDLPLIEFEPKPSNLLS
jgi:hypothetical protein